MVTSPKTNFSYRSIPNFLVKDLEDLYDKESKTYEFKNSWFVLSATTLLSRRSKNAIETGVKEIRIHDFRHSCASLLIDNEANITLVAKYLGHSKSVKTLFSLIFIDFLFFK